MVQPRIFIFGLSAASHGNGLASGSPSVFGLLMTISPKCFATDRIANQWGFITARVPGVKPPGTYWLK
jgi:uncharacterized protein (DUF362 family)